MPALGPPGALSPSQWGAQVNYDAWRDLFSPDDGVALHHGGGSDYPAGRTPYTVTKEKAQLQSWETYHLSKGWRGLAYGWGVGQTGTIYRIRGWADYGAHTGDVDGDGIANNKEIVPIIFIGSGNHHNLSPAAQASIVNLRQFIEDGSPRATRLYGHQEISPATGTTCPGPKGMAYVTTHRYLEEEDMPLTTDDVEAIWSAKFGKGDNIKLAGHLLAEAARDAAIARALAEKQAQTGRTLSQSDIDAIIAEHAESFGLIERD